MDELEIVRSEVDHDGGVGENEDSEVVVVDVREPFVEVCAGFGVQGSHGSGRVQKFVM